jgi:hypothetical protein
MASTFSPSLRIELIGNGDQSGVWGQTTNNNLGGLIEQAITGVETISITADANYALTNFNGISDQSRNAVLVISGAISQVRDIIAPLVEKLYIVKNSTSGGFAINIRTASGSPVSVPNGATVWVYCDGTNFNAVGTESVGNFEVNGNLTVTGTTTLTGSITGSIAIDTASFGDGAAATPSITNTGDLNTGIFFPAADTIAFSDGGVESMRIDVNGNVGIGNTDPSFSLGPFEGVVMQSQGISSQFRLYTSGSSGLADTNGAGITVYNKQFFVSNKENDDIVFETNGLQNMRLKPSGNLEVAGSVTAKDFSGTATNSDEGGQINLAGGTSYTTFNKSIDVFQQDLRMIGEGNFAVQILSTTGSASLAVQGSLFFNSGYGSAAVAYGCRAWVNFNGQGTPAIRASGNVSSITDNGSGTYVVNFTTALVDNHYAAVATAEHATGTTRSTGVETVTYTTGGFDLNVGYGTTRYDPNIILAAVFR